MLALAIGNPEGPLMAGLRRSANLNVDDSQRLLLSSFYDRFGGWD